jgi:hypothetical protein
LAKQPTLNRRSAYGLFSGAICANVNLRWIPGVINAGQVGCLMIRFERRAAFSALAAVILLTVMVPAAQAQPAPPVAQPPAAASPAPTVSPDSIGSVATVQGSATVTRASATTQLKAGDEIFDGDTVQTGANGALGITFDDETTFNMGANAIMVMNNLVYRSGGTSNAGLFNVVRGTVAFFAGQVAHTGDMRIETPTATLGVRGTTGVIDVPANATAPGDVSIKLYNDADGHLGRIEVFGAGRNGARLGVLDRAASGFSIRRGAGGAYGAFALAISPQQAARDRGFVGNLFRSRDIGRRFIEQRRNIRFPGQRGFNPRGPNNRGGLNNLRNPNNRGGVNNPRGFNQRGFNAPGRPGARPQNFRNPPGARPRGQRAPAYERDRGRRFGR